MLRYYSDLFLVRFCLEIKLCFWCIIYIYTLLLNSIEQFTDLPGFSRVVTFTGEVGKEAVLGYFRFMGYTKHVVRGVLRPYG